MRGHAVSQRKQAGGFSLLELMVVMALLAILAVLATPSMSEWTRNQRIRGEAEALLNGLQKAREEAIRRNRPVSFWLVSDLSSGCALSNTSGTWVVSINTPAGKCNSAPSASADPMLVTSNESRNVDVQADGSEVRFNGYGRATANSSSGAAITTIDIRDPADASNTNVGSHTYRSLRVNIQGSGFRLCDPRITTAGDTRRC